jgi:hypothetical protein
MKIEDRSGRPFSPSARLLRMGRDKGGNREEEGHGHIMQIHGYFMQGRKQEV